MGLSITTIAQSLLLTTRARFTEDLGSLAVADQALADRLIREASAAIVSYCHRPFAREAVTELCGAYGGVRLQLARTPIIAVSSVIYNSQTVTDYTVEDAGRGWLYRQGSWFWTAQVYGGLGASYRWPDYGTPLPRQEEPQVSASYVAGYLLPAQNLVSVATVSVAAADNSFNDSASGFPTLLKAGDVIETSGFTNAGNNGRFVVTGTPTAAKITVSASLTLENAAAGRTVLVQTLPEDVERACLETVKSWFATRTTDSNIVEKQAGPMRIRYEEGRVDTRGIPAVAAGLLVPWVRAA